MTVRRYLVVGLTFGLASVPTPIPCQGVTTAALQGTVAQEGGAPVGHAGVVVINTAAGQRWHVETSDQGRYFIEHVAVGGPYRIEVRAIGFVPAQQDIALLTLGERHTADFLLKPVVYELPAVTVSSAADPLINAGRTGPAHTLTDTALARLPSLTRNFLDFAQLSPQVTPSQYGAVSIGSQNPIFTSLQIDGGLNSDLYTGGPAGNGWLPFPLSLETIAQIEVLAAPTDVRSGSFAGGLVNAVTKSGTNTLHGSTFAFFQNQDLVGTDTAGVKSADFTSWQYGGSLSGPIIHDRLHFLLNLDLQNQIIPDNGPFIDDTAGGADTLQIGIPFATAQRFQQILRQTYGLRPGELGRSDTRLPAQDILGKVTGQLGTNNHFEVSHHYARTHQLISPFRAPSYYALGGFNSDNIFTENASRLMWTGIFGGRWSNELILSYLATRLNIPNGNPLDIVAYVDTSRLEAFPASPSGLRPLEVSTDAVEITDNVTVSVGRHLVTAGTHNELLRFRDNNFNGSGGLWVFGSVDSLALGLANHYERTVPGFLRPYGPVVDFHVRQFGVYLQDRWAATQRLALTGGLRVDIPLLPDAAVMNPGLKTSLGLDTGRLPSGNPLWSPRLGVSYDLRGDGTGFLRGSVGLFSGRPAYRWIANGYRDSGGEQALLVCDGNQVPHFDPANPPTTCTSGAQSIARITVFDPGFRFPQNLKFGVGVDQRLPWGMVGTIDVLYTRGVNQLYFTDANLIGPVGAASGEAGRILYGTIDSTGRATPARRDTTVGRVVRVSNSSGDRTFSASVELQKRFAPGMGFSASYTYSHTEDLFSLINFFSFLNLANNPLDGTVDERRRRTSLFDIPHRVSLAGFMHLPFKTELSVVYTGASQEPFSYVVDGDANADGINARAFGYDNDLLYVPRIAVPGGDISLVVPDDLGNLVPASAAEYARLDTFINQEKCLREQRGRILGRNSCRNGWLGFLNARVTKTFPTARGQSLQLAVDMFNVLNLIDHRWGQYRQTTDPIIGGLDPEVHLLRLVGYDSVKQRGMYELELPPTNWVQDFPSRWRMQLSLRYTF